MRAFIPLTELFEASTGTGATGAPQPDKTGSLVRHCMVAVAKKYGGDANRARDICTASMKKNGFLKPDGRVTQKGSQRNMKHSMEKDNPGKQTDYEKLRKKESGGA